MKHFCISKLKIIFLVILFNFYSSMSFAKYQAATAYGRLSQAIENGNKMEVEIEFNRGFRKNDAKIVYPETNQYFTRCALDVNEKVLPRWFGSNDYYVDSKLKFKLNRSKKPASHPEFSLWELDTSGSFTDTSVITNITCEFKENVSPNMLAYLYPIFSALKITIVSIEE